MKLSPFIVERQRDIYAKNRNKNKFLETYSRKYPEIEDKNTAHLWDELNTRNLNIFTEDPMAAERIEYVAKLIQGNCNVLDLGFGSGNLERALAKTGMEYNLLGVDISPVSVNIASEKFPVWNFKVSSIINLGVQEKFDYVVSLEVFEHIPPSKVMAGYRHVHKLLKKTGRFIISVPLNEGLEGMVSSGINPNAHLRSYTKDTLLFELEISGFKVLNWKVLYAFHRFHNLKSIIAKLSLGVFKPNNIIVIATKK